MELYPQKEDEGTRIDSFVFAQTDDDISRSRIQKLIKDELIFVNGKPIKASYRVCVGDIIVFDPPESLDDVDILPENIPLDILYEDDDILIVNKPKGMVVHPAPGHYSGTLVNAVMFHCKDSLSGINGALRPGIVHRIDKDTTGSIIICKNDASHRLISEQIASHSIKRIYQGIICGHLKDNEGTINAPIGRSPKDRKKMAVVQNGKRAVTHYRVIRDFEKHQLVEFLLETGRTHQIRVHMANINHPILGDELYQRSKQPFKLQGQCLHAMTIGFIHPSNGQYTEINAPIPEYFDKLIESGKL